MKQYEFDVPKLQEEYQWHSDGYTFASMPKGTHHMIIRELAGGLYEITYITNKNKKQDILLKHQLKFSLANLASLIKRLSNIDARNNGLEVILELKENLDKA